LPEDRCLLERCPQNRYQKLLAEVLLEVVLFLK
jgi:hypothetical protein